ncbi:MAG: Tol-Pal system beta propeller repeat protein TolB [Myxococcota bacterium]
MDRARSLLAILSLLAGGPVAAQERPTVVVTPGTQHQYRVAVQRFADFSTQPDSSRASTFRRDLIRALDFASVFVSIDLGAFLGPEVTEAAEAPPVCSDWAQIGADVLVKGEIRNTAERSEAEFSVWDTVRCRMLLHRVHHAPAGDSRIAARRIADDLAEEFTGVRGVAATELAYVSDRSGTPEIYVMETDGGNRRPVTSNGSINNFPSWSPDGKSILYTSYQLGNRPRLYLSSRGRGRPGPLLPRVASDLPQYRAVFDPTGRNLALVLSAEGAADIFTARASGRRLRRLTKNRAIDIAPTWSPDGKRIAFVSDRSGSPQIYIMRADGKNIRRLTYQGTYNTHPDWSPDGRWIVYETRLEGQFDIWLIDPEGSVNVPLVSHPRSDESPTWAPSGRKLAFSSTRRGAADIYIIDVSGENLRRLTSMAGSNTSPAWGPQPR